MARILDNEQVGSFKLIDRIGEGGMAVIYKATQPSLHRTVVIKKLKDPNREIIARFKKEALVSASFSHENVLAIYDFLYIGRSYFLVMEYVDGEDLRDIIDHASPMPARIAALIIREVAKGLEYTHSKNIIHRDIKPSNILISKDGEVKLIDFGIAKDEAPTKLTMTGMIVGTPSYMSPEQANGDAIGKPSDIYSLGVLLYEMVTGVKPFLGDTNTEILLKIIKGKFPSPRKFNKNIPYRLVRIIKKAMRKDVEGRYHFASEMIRDINKFLHWQEQARKKDILSEYIRKFDKYRKTPSSVSLNENEMYSPNRWRLRLVSMLAVLIVVFSTFQINRFLQNERLASLTISSNSASADVIVDGTVIGRLTGEQATFSNLPAGRHLVEIRGDDNFGVFASTLNLEPGVIQTLIARLPERNTVVSMRIFTEPSGAEILLDDRLLGRTPLDQLRIRSGAHTLTISRPGFQALEQKIFLDKNQQYTYDVVLTPEE